MQGMKINGEYLFFGDELFVATCIFGFLPNFIGGGRERNSRIKSSINIFKASVSDGVGAFSHILYPQIISTNDKKLSDSGEQRILRSRLRGN